jgi:transposase
MRKLSLKKKLPELARSKPDKEFFFFDESRFGTHSKIGHGWFKKGSRTTTPMKLGFKNFYLYTAVKPISGESFSYLLPQVNTECFNAYLCELAKAMTGRKLVLIMDGAGWHKSNSLIIPDNIEIMYLPPYSPELNPVETLWEHIKRHTIKNKIYDTLNELEEAICTFILGLTQQDIASICKADYLYN